MVSVPIVTLAVIVAVVNCQDQGKYVGNSPVASTKQTVCADMMQEVNDCLDQLQNGQDSKLFHARRKQIFKKCIPNQSAQCSGMFSAMERCNEQVRADPVLHKARDAIKDNVAKCYERFPNSRKAGGGRPVFPMGAPPVGPQPGQAPFGAPPMPPPGFGADPCAPTSEQMMCIKHAMDTDKNMTNAAARLHDQERQCFTKNPNMASCRPDSAQLRECLDQTAQSFMVQVGEKMQKCVRDAGYEMPQVPPPVQAFSG